LRFLFFGAFRNVRHREKAQQHQRLPARVAGGVLFTGWYQYSIARLERVPAAALGLGATLAGHHVDALLEALVKVHAARLVARLRDRNFHQPQRDGLRSLLAGDDLERFPPGKPHALRVSLGENLGHQLAFLSCLISAVPPCASSSRWKISAASFAMASAIPFTIFTPFPTLPSSALPYH